MADILNAGEIVNRMMELALNRSREASLKMSANFDKVMGYVPSSGVTMSPASLNWNPNVIEPKVHIPELAEGASIELFDSWWQRVNDSLIDKAEWFFQRFFPNECPYLARAQLWICKTLAEGGTGMNPRVEDMIWQRDRARLLKEASRAEKDLIASFAAKGFPLPSGPMLAGLQRIREDTLDKTAQASRDVAIKQAEIEIENVRFAVDQAIKLYNNCISAVGEFIKALVSSAGMSAQLIPSITDSQSKLISAASEYYKSRIMVQELFLKSRATDAGFKQEASKSNQAAHMQAIDMRVRAAIEAAKAFAMEMSAALNALHANAGVSGSGATSVSYSYTNETQGQPPAKTII